VYTRFLARHTEQRDAIHAGHGLQSFALTSDWLSQWDDRMTYVDSAILNLIEQLCRRFQVWTGRTNVWLAFQLTNLSVVVYFLWVAGLYLLSGDVAFRVFVALFCGGVFFVLTRTIFKASVEVSEAQAYRRLAKGLKNPRRIRDAQLRIAFLTLSIVLSYPLWLAFVTLHLRFALFTEGLILLTTVVLYVLACDPLPPCAGTLNEWLRGMAPARRADAGRLSLAIHGLTLRGVGRGESHRQARRRESQ
jgi:hypothetical protein